MKRPLISVVVPMFNTEAYISQALHSIIRQTIGFKQNIEVILVDDGSTDGTVRICDEFVKKYPDNFYLYKQQNQGVSAARNMGLKYAQGTYINFLDADDIWQKTAYKKMIRFLDQHSDIDFVAAKVKFFDRSIDEHPLNYKFVRSRVIDLTKEPDTPALHVISCVIKREAIDGRKFDSTLSIAEDAKFLNELLVEKKCYGVITDTHYNYRKRSNNTSAVDTGSRTKSYYTVTPECAYESLISSWTQSGKLHPYMQYLLLYDLSYRIKGVPYKLLSPTELKKYIKTIHRIVQFIDEDRIRSSRWYDKVQKDYLLNFRASTDPSEFGCVSREDAVVVVHHPILNILFNWRIKRVSKQLQRLRRYNLSQLNFKTKLLEYAKPWLIMLEALADIPKAIVVRASYSYQVKNKTRPIWIISDRVMAAGDNGEALFSYVQSQDITSDVYFAISRKSKDYQRLAKIGPVLHYGGVRYLVKFLLADKIISSHADVETTNPFGRNVDHYEDLIKHDFVFLQHGVISNDLSRWLNKHEKKIRLFITSSELERESIVDNPWYGYEPDEVVVTGLARWDLLSNQPKNKIIIAPTFRADLLVSPADKRGTRQYNPDFKYTEYFKFYNRLINDPRIIHAMKLKNMTAELLIHPNFEKQAKDFSPGECFYVATFPYDYATAISTGSMLVSDYSSIPYDFAYLHKPVLYAQFDAERFYKSHSYDKGFFFSYEENGFGPVTKNYDETVVTIVKLIKRGCTLDKEYRDRVDNYFYKFDDQNRRRILAAIMEL